MFPSSGTSPSEEVLYHDCQEPCTATETLNRAGAGDIHTLVYNAKPCLTLKTPSFPCSFTTTFIVKLGTTKSLPRTLFIPSL